VDGEKLFPWPGKLTVEVSPSEVGRFPAPDSHLDSSHGNATTWITKTKCKTTASCSWQRDPNSPRCCSELVKIYSVQSVNEAGKITWLASKVKARRIYKKHFAITLNFSVLLPPLSAFCLFACFFCWGNSKFHPQIQITKKRWTRKILAQLYGRELLWSSSASLFFGLGIRRPYNSYLLLIKLFVPEHQNNKQPDNKFVLKVSRELHETLCTKQLALERRIISKLHARKMFFFVQSSEATGGKKGLSRASAPHWEVRDKRRRTFDVLSTVANTSSFVLLIIITENLHTCCNFQSFWSWFLIIQRKQTKEEQKAGFKSKVFLSSFGGGEEQKSSKQEGKVLADVVVGVVVSRWAKNEWETFSCIFNTSLSKAEC
jgi:hypothetical protein